MADDGETGGLLTLVCLTCGNQKDYADKVPNRVICERCGGTVFRNFYTPAADDEVARDQLEDTGRSVALGDESPDITPDDLRDLNNP